MKATPRKLAYVDSNKQAPTGSLARGFSDRFSLESSGTSDTHKQSRSASKSQRTPSKNKETTHLRRSRRLEDRSITKEKARRERSKPKGKSFEELSQNFLEEFSQQKRYAKDPKEIHGIKRRQNKGLQSFMDRFKFESSHIKGGSQHQLLLSVKKANRESCGLEKVSPSGERYPPNQSKERKPRKEQCEGNKHDKRRRKSQKVKIQKMQSSDGRLFKRNTSSPRSNRSLSKYGKSRKNQIRMTEDDEEKTAFHAEEGIYCFTHIPKELKNSAATLQRMMEEVLAEQRGRNLEM
ncbi:hypothetical protein Tco_1164448 [Tanacetum coccineum]